MRVLGSLALVIVVMLAFAWLAKRRGWLQYNSNNNIKVISNHRIGPRSHITIVDVEDTRLILGITQTHINLLHKIDHNPSSNNNGTSNKNRNSVQDIPANSEEELTSLSDNQLKSKNTFDQLLKKKLVWLAGIAIFTSLAVMPTLSYAQALLPALTAGPTAADGSQTWSLSVQTLVLLTLMSFLPAMLLTMTGFTRIVIVLGLLRNAMGTGASPPNSVLIGLALFLTFFAMSPVFDQVYAVAWQPLSSGAIELQDALQLGIEPFREFMLRQTREADLIMFANMANITELDSPESLPLRVLIPSFITSELKTAFQIGFTIFIPFLIIDLLVASTLMSLGMMMVPPVTIALPFKLMLFVLADGWHLLLGSLARSFYQ